MNLLHYWKMLPIHPLQRRLAYISMRVPRNTPGEISFDGLTVAYTDMLSFYMEYKDIFLNRIYHFEPATAEPFIIDGGGCIGMSVLYFKKTFPDSSILCFEPDENMFGMLKRNVDKNGIKDVELVQAGISEDGSSMSFMPDGSDGGRFVEDGTGSTTIRTVRLSKYLDRPVDFLKLNIEGQELAVLKEVESSGKFGSIRELVIEYHGWPGGKQGLGEILNILDRQGYRYIVHDFDAKTCPASKPPFRIQPDTAWYCLVYAARQE